MKNLFLALVFASLNILFFTHTPSQPAEGQCAVANGFGCDGATADALRIKLYKLALCTEKPTYLDDSSCVYLFNEATPMTLELSIGSQLPIVQDQISIPKNVYTHSLMLIDKGVDVKTTVNLADGRTCWTDGDDIPFYFKTQLFMNQPSYPVTCGAAPNPQWSTQNFLSLDATNKRLNQTTANNSIDLYLLNDLTTAANVVQGNDPNHGWPTLNSDANYVWGVQTFNQPVTVDANTTNIDLGFRLTEALSLKYFQDFPFITCGYPWCAAGVTISNFEFLVSAQ
ncbi:MAG: hypothetical protein ACO20S_01215 [Paracoccaceae bacterium]